MINYDALKVDGLKDVLEAIATACSQLDIDFFLVGAVARNIWYANSNKKIRGTEDIDFGIYVPDQKTYNKLKNHLIQKYDYIQAYDNVFGLNTPDGKRIDLLPFGEIANDGEVIMEGKGMTRIKLDGFEEAYKDGSVKTKIENETYKSCSIPGIVILKLIAYDDRPDRRIKDIKDIVQICVHFPEIEREIIWTEHNDLNNREISHDEISLIVLGRLMKKIMASNAALTQRIIHIIDGALNGDSDIVEHMIVDRMTETLDDKAAILELIKRGITE